ncbi:Amiloride-sensitive sodium channel subunit gamma [Nymphon striatum]|nr:Amiloride-sensitive sodium channel subunit gamma [Nymphon striatum]
MKGRKHSFNLLLDVDEASAKIKKNKKKQKEDKAKSRRKILWRIVFLFSLVGFTYQSYQFLKEYLSNPVVITGYVQTGVPQNFPSITVCSYSKHSLKSPDSSVHLNPPDRAFCFGLFTAAWLKPSRSVTNSCSKDSISVAASLKFIVGSCRRFYDSKALIDHKNMKSLRKIESATTIDERIELGQSAESVIYSCHFMGRVCDYKNFTHSYTYKYGNCWNFDPENEDGEPSKALEAGPMFGLNLDLYFDKSTTIELLDRIIGFRLSVHNRGEVPFPEDQGLDISLQKQTSVGIYSSSKRWLPPPYYSNCIDKDPSQYFKPEYFNSTKRIYTTQTVSKESYGENVNVLMPYLYFHGSRYDGQVCDVDNQTEICCMEQVIGSLRHGINCNCTIPCQEQLGRVKVFFESLDTRIDIILPKYQLADVFSNIGGQVGLWLGISLVALYEVGENFIISLYERIKSSGSRKR